ncbi:DNA glycosylase AlkZ-like family protein [Microbacterium sp. 179-I 3D4 NHS]|uniref:DNA glycosylase AlkZ-like family protein n=1 Tax=Microbacterium sp. 179-I 3D4 NHS TaxID=3142381 RepID=UPI0039A22FAB
MDGTWRQALNWRGRQHFLTGPPAADVPTVVERLIALPAWSGDVRTALGLRREPGSDDLDTALAEHRVIVTYSFRGSTHVMHPRTAGAHLAIRGSGRQWELASWRTHYRLEAEDWPRLRAVVRDALSGGPKTRPELAAAVTAVRDFAHLEPAFLDKSQTFLKPFAWQGDMCFGPSRDGELTFQQLDGIPGWEGVPPLDDAGPTAVRAYLHAYGPTTTDRIRYWLGEGLSAGRKRLDGWIEHVRAETADLRVDGEDVLLLEADVDDLRAAPDEDGVVLLPGLDPWVMGPGTADEHVVPPAHRQVVTRGANLVVVGGRVAGTWKATKDADVEVEWFEADAGAPGAAVDAARERLRSAR